MSNGIDPKVVIDFARNQGLLGWHEHPTQREFNALAVRYFESMEDRFVQGGMTMATPLSPAAPAPFTMDDAHRYIRHMFQSEIMAWGGMKLVEAERETRRVLAYWNCPEAPNDSECNALVFHCGPKPVAAEGGK